MMRDADKTTVRNRKRKLRERIKRTLHNVPNGAYIYSCIISDIQELEAIAQQQGASNAKS